MFPCFLCGELLEIKKTIKDKPYFICDPCGVQAFVRRAEGIGKLKGLCWNQENSPGYLTEEGYLRRVRRIQQLGLELKQLRNEIGPEDGA